MKLPFASALLAAALLTAAAPALASDDSAQSAPIRLDQVHITQSYGIFNDFFPGLATIAFTNQSPVTATSIVFDLHGYQGAVIAQYQDVGTYRQGATVRHSFPDIHTDNDQQISVSAVTFADGSSWSAPWNHAQPATVFPSE